MWHYEFLGALVNTYLAANMIIWLNACVHIGGNVRILCMDAGWEKPGEVNEYLKRRWPDKFENITSATTYKSSILL